MVNLQIQGEGREKKSLIPTGNEGQNHYNQQLNIWDGEKETYCYWCSEGQGQQGAAVS